MTEIQTKTELDSILDLPPLCEMGAKDKSGEATFRDRADAECEGFGRWLIVGGHYGDAPSPICDKHRNLLLDRVGADYLFKEHGMKVIES